MLRNDRQPRAAEDFMRFPSRFFMVFTLAAAIASVLADEPIDLADQPRIKNDDQWMPDTWRKPKIAADAPPEVREAIEAGQEDRKRRFQNLLAKTQEAKAVVETKSELLEEVKKARILQGAGTGVKTPKGWVFGHKLAKEQAIQQVSRELDSAKTAVQEVEAAAHEVATQPYVISPMSNPLKVGSFGSVEAITIVQVVDEKTMLGKATISGVQELFYVTEIETEGFVDGRWFRPQTPMKIVGTKKYETVGGGSKTVFELRPLEIRKYVVSDGPD